MAFRRVRLFLVIALSMAPLAALTYPQGADGDAAKEGYQAPTHLIESLEGRDLFRAYCAACHGADARGSGPAAASLKSKPPDLTRIAQRRGMVFPLAEVEKIIAGEESASATHGMREMPIWGPILGQVQRDQSLGKVRIRNLANYLESLQEGR
jgi:mono/diheme cytochrome c family protein